MRGRGFWARLLTGVVVAAPLAAVAVAGPASAASESESYLSYVSQAGDWVGQGRTGTISDPAQLSVGGTAGSVRFTADTGTEYWDVSLAAPKGQQLTTGVYENAARAPFNDRYPGLSVSSTGRGCNAVKGRFTIFAISADTSGRITSLDATLTQFCDSSSGGLTATVKYAAPYVTPIVLTSSNPVTVADQPVTLTARVAPGTGPVSFRDGSTVLGQASPDAASLARFTTAGLGAGTHSLYASQGTASSARLTQVVSAAETSLWFASQNGDFIGQGASASYVEPSASVRVSGTTGVTTLSVDGPSTSEWWTVEVAAPPGETLHVGSYTGAGRAAFRGPGQPGLDVSGSGRGCNTLTGAFTVNGIAANPDGSIASLDVSFTQSCESGPTSLSGRARFRAGAATPPAATTTSLTATATGPLQASFTATVTGGGTVPAGRVVFSEGGTALGASTLDASGSASLVATLTRGAHVITASYDGSPTSQPSSAATSVSLAGFATTTTATAPKSAKAGRPLSVAVTVSSGSGSSPSGLVRLYDGVEPVGSAATLVDGKASIVWTPASKGQRSLTVRYAGDTRHAESVSPTVVVRVS